MKKNVYYSGYITVFFAVLAACFKLFHLPYAGVLISVSLLALCVFFPLYIIDRSKDLTGGKTSPANIVLAIGLILFILAMMFKLNHWPGTGLIMAVSLLVLIVGFCPLWFYQKSKEPGANKIMYAVGALGFALLFLSLLTKVQHWPGQEYFALSGAALVVLVYFPMFMFSKSIPEEKKIRVLTDTFFAIIITCIIIVFSWGIFMGTLIPPPVQ
jgi:hypothetical protein